MAKSELETSYSRPVLRVGALCGCIDDKNSFTLYLEGKEVGFLVAATLGSRVGSPDILAYGHIRRRVAVLVELC